jgi:hypothetical protein
MKIAYARVRAHKTGIKTQKKPTNMGRAFVIKNGTKTTHISMFDMIVTNNKNPLRYFCGDFSNPVSEDSSALYKLTH